MSGDPASAPFELGVCPWLAEKRNRRGSTRTVATFRGTEKFMGGIYVMEFETGERAARFVSTYSACPMWPVVARLPNPRQVFILAIELRAQQHGDFTQDSNTLTQRPELVGARSVVFRRDDGLLELFVDHSLRTGLLAHAPCGSECLKCPSYLAPCRGCPATIAFQVETQAPHCS